MYRNQYNNFKRQKKRSKKNIVRIFWQLPAKKSLRSLDFRALQEDTVEMKFTRLRGLTQCTVLFCKGQNICRNEVYPIKGIDTSRKQAPN